MSHDLFDYVENEKEMRFVIRKINEYPTKSSSTPYGKVVHDNISEILERESSEKNIEYFLSCIFY